MEYCEGGTLRSHLATTSNLSAPLPLADTKHLIGDILKGLSHIHQQGIIHDDLKPENIFLTYPYARSHSKEQNSSPQTQLTLKIGDFGSARLQETPSQSQQEIGSPTYAAPERFGGKSSTASDLYSVGIILYELLLGDRPFSGSPTELERAHQTEPIPFPPTITFAARQLLETALHKHPKHRFPSADAMLSALQNLTSTTTDQPKPSPKPSKINSGLARATLNQAPLALIPSNGIMAPVEALLTIPQGCCIITERSLHLLTPKNKLLSIARFTQPCWIAVSPSGKWFAAVTKQKDNFSSEQEQTSNLSDQQTLTTASTPKSTRRYSKGMIGHLGNHSGHRWRRSITLTGPLLTTLQAQVLQLIALNERYLLRVSTTASRTYLEFFTRRGQFIREYTLELPLAQVAPTMMPYQLIALSAPTANASAVTFLITLHPFQLQRIHLPKPSTASPSTTPLTATQRINAFPWGYLISDQRKGLLLDRSTQVAGELEGLPPNSAVAAINSRKILLASAKPSKATNKRTETLRPKTLSSLLVANVSDLDLGIIF